MKIFIQLIIVFNLFHSTTSFAQAPANDECTAAATITTEPFGTSCSSSVNASTSGATRSIPNPSCTSAENDDDIWYRFTAVSESVVLRFGNVRNNITGGSATAGFALYEASCPSASAGITCTNLGSSTPGYRIFSGLTIGENYYLRIWSTLTGTNTISFTFCLQEVAPPPINDECSGAIPFTVTPYGVLCSSTVTGNTQGATKSSPDPSCTSLLDDDDIWYSFLATSASIALRAFNATSNMTGQGSQVGIALYGTGCPTDTSTIVCSNIITGGGGFLIINGLSPGNKYYFRFWSYTATDYVSFEFCVQEVIPPSNDECINATSIVSQPVGTLCDATYNATTIGATPSMQGPSCASNFYDDDIWYSFIPGKSAVRINFTNARQAAISSGIANVGYALYDEACPSFPVEFSCNANIGNGSGSELVGGLTPGHQYYLRFYSYGANNYITFDFCVVDIDVPPNDECVNAIDLPVTNGFCTSPVGGTLFNATPSPGYNTPACTASAFSEDVWFKLTVPPSGNITVQTSAVNTQVLDLVMEAYDGNCNALSLITCDDDGNPEAHPSALHSRVILTGRIPNEVMYVRVIAKNNLSLGDFVICAWDHSVLPPVSPGGNCIATNTATVNTANLNRYMWVPLFDGAGNIVAEVNADGNNLNTINSSLFTNTSGVARNMNGYYLNRNISIEPSNNDAARVRIYFTDNELTALQAADPSVISINSLNITKTSVNCQPAFSGTGSVIIPDAFADYGTDHYVEFTTPSFSSFYLNSANVVLPLRFISFEAKKKNPGIELTWKVVKDNVIKDFEIAYSYDGNNFISIGLINQSEFIYEENDSRTYKYFHNDQHDGNIFYRIKMNNFNGGSIYSSIIKINLTDFDQRIFSVYPNPSAGKFILRTKTPGRTISIILLSSTGQKVKDYGLLKLQNGNVLDLGNLPSEIYFLKITEVEANKIYYERITKFR